MVRVGGRGDRPVDHLPEVEHGRDGGAHATELGVEPAAHLGHQRRRAWDEAHAG